MQRQAVCIYTVLFHSSPPPVHSCCRSSKADATFNWLFKQKRLWKSFVSKIFHTKLEHWLIPACLAVPKGTELTTVNIWQEASYGHGTWKIFSFLDSFTSKIAPQHLPCQSSTKGWIDLDNTSVQNVNITKMNMHLLLWRYWQEKDLTSLPANFFNLLTVIKGVEY